MPNISDVFIDIGATTKREIRARCEVAKEEYIKVVDMEHAAFLRLVKQQVFPKAYEYLNTLSKTSDPELSGFPNSYK